MKRYFADTVFVLFVLFVVIAFAQIPEEGKRQFLRHKATVKETAARIAELRRNLDIENLSLDQQEAILSTMRKGFTASCLSRNLKFIEEPEPQCR